MALRRHIFFRPPPRDREVEVEMHASAGDLIAHLGFTIHRSQSNTSERQRWALGLPLFAQDSRVMPKADWLRLHDRNGG